MIEPRAAMTRTAVAAHYDDLDRFYRELWGEHLHHGLWRTGRESPEEAARQLTALVAGRAGVGPGDRVCDVGCGYGGTARVLAQEHGAAVTGLTISRAQYDYAVALDPAADNPAYLLRDWAENGLEPGSFDAVIAVESTEHMPDKAGFFAEAARVLRPGGRLVVCAWLTAPDPGRLGVRHLLEPICREGRLFGMGTADDYRRLAAEAGFGAVDVEDLSRQVKKTWPVCVVRTLKGLARRPEYRRFLVQGGSADRVFALTLFRIWAAYELGLMRYGLLTAVKPAVPDEGRARPAEALAVQGGAREEAG
jgi:tocopherol O-methyltransferase